MNEGRVRGAVHVVEETKSFGQSGFQKRLIVLEHKQGRFTSHIPLELIRDQCHLADDLNVGDEIEATYQLNGRKWQRDEQSEVKFFLSAELKGFEVTRRAGDKPAAHLADADSEWDAAAGEEEVPF